MNVANTHPSGHGMNGRVYFAEGLAPTLTANEGEGIKVITIEKINDFPITVAVNKAGRNVTKLTDIAPCLAARDYKGFVGKAEKIAVIEERKEQDNEQREQPGLPNSGDA